jgi:hypothetical protein
VLTIIVSTALLLLLLGQRRLRSHCCHSGSNGSSIGSSNSCAVLRRCFCVG